MTTLNLCPHCGCDIERDEPIQLGDVAFDPLDGITVNGKHLQLPGAEREILHTLLKAKGRGVSFDALAERIGSDTCGYAKVVKVYVCRLRKRLATIGCEDRCESIRGYGYRWTVPQRAQLMELAS